MDSLLSPMAGTSLVCGPEIDHELQILLAGCVRTLYQAIAAPNAPTACAFTSTVLADALGRVGIQARALPVAVEGELPEGKFGIGHPAYPLARPGAWKGHACCMIGDLLIDPTISNIRRMGIEAPLMVAVRTDRPWHPAATLVLSANVRLTWSPADASVKLSTHADLRSPLRGPATARTAAALEQLLASHAIDAQMRQEWRSKPLLRTSPATPHPGAVAADPRRITL